MARILLIEDKDYICDMFVDALAMGGHQVRCCATISEGIDAYLDDPPDLLISDWGLPDGSGSKAVNRIIEEHHHCELIVSTGHDPSIVTDALEEKVGLHYDILRKPFKIPELLEKVTKFLN